MVDRGEPIPPDAERAQSMAPSTDTEQSPEPAEAPGSAHSRKYGQQPVIAGASGRRARLRHPARGAVRR